MSETISLTFSLFKVSDELWNVLLVKLSVAPWISDLTFIKTITFALGISELVVESVIAPVYVIFGVWTPYAVTDENCKAEAPLMYARGKLIVFEIPYVQVGWPVASPGWGPNVRVTYAVLGVLLCDNKYALLTVSTPVILEYWILFAAVGAGEDRIRYFPIF